MDIVEIIFWLCLVAVLYTYVGYGVLLGIIICLKKVFSTTKGVPNKEYEPTVALVIPVFNEENVLEDRIQNCLSLKYPAQKLQLIFITDGSTDNSNAIIASHPKIQLLFEPKRKGKMAAVNRAMKYVTAEIVVFSDANSFLNNDCIVNVARHYNDPAIGGVAGEKKIVYFKKPSFGVGEGIYWKYESLLKQLDSDFNTVVGAAGELFSMRAILYKPQPEHLILDDLTLSLQVCLGGHRIVYEPLAYAWETPSLNLAEEAKRRIRIASGAFQTLFEYISFAKMMRFPLLAFQFFSRRVLKWLVCPPALAILFLCNIQLAALTDKSFYLMAFFLQITFYSLAGIGWLTYKLGRQVNVFFIPFYFVFMNVSLVAGFVRYLMGKHTSVWEMAQRSVINNRLPVREGHHMEK